MKKLVSYLFILAAFISCRDNNDPLKDGNDWDIVIPSSQHAPGIGNTDGPHQGTPWELPDGIELVRRPGKSFDPNPQMLYGSLNTFYADVSFVNHLDVSVSILIPAGLIWVFNREGRTQDGLLTSTVKVDVPPTFSDEKSDTDTTTIYLGLGCLNYSKAFPWEENQEEDTRDYPIGKDMYKPGVVTSDPNLRKLLDLLKDYPGLGLTRHYNPQEMFEPDYKPESWREIYMLIQGALWDITDNNGLTRKSYRELSEALKSYR
ncbi:hypothetical protein GCM10023091_04530 [Ravibacter arvi]|uniref:Uncharacterized protein n=1 Tax=Ravibacter arvi TaxID=2051041 RepID=A0ABP8LQ62_9BACT